MVLTLKVRFPKLAIDKINLIQKTVIATDVDLVIDEIDNFFIKIF
jgi:hypothetical protein